MSQAKLRPPTPLSTLALVGLLLLSAGDAAAQGTILAVDQTVRIELQGGGTPVQGRLAAMTPTEWAVELESGTLRSFAPEDIMKVEVQRMRRATRRGLTIGAAAGLGLGLAYRYLNDNCGGDEGQGICDTADGAVVLWAPIAGGLIGAGVGHLIVTHPWVPGIFIDYTGTEETGVGLMWSVGWSF